MRDKLLLGVLLILFLAAGVTYSLVTPIFEASDEFLHYPVVTHLAGGKGLPVTGPAGSLPDAAIVLGQVEIP